MGRPPLNQQPNTLLAYWMKRCNLSNIQLARLVTDLARARGVTGIATDESRVRAWLRGSVPRSPVPGLIAEGLSARAGVDLSCADIGLPGDAGPVSGVRLPWTRTSALAAFSQIIRSELMLPDTRHDPDTANVHSGSDLLAPLQEWALLTPSGAGAPAGRAAAGRRIGMSDVEGVRQVTAMFRDMDNRHGGVLSRAAVLAQTDTVLNMLKDGTYSEDVGRAMFAAAADLGSVAGWMSFDAGRHVAAQKTFVSALHAAAEARDQALGAHILQCMARQMSHLGRVEDALELVSLAQYGARRQMTPATASMLAALEARFQAILGRPADSDAAAGRAESAFEQVDQGGEPAHMAFFDLAELNATVGMAHQIAAKHLDGKARATRVRRSEALVLAALASRPEHRQRSKAFDHLGLARTHLVGGEVEGAAVETARCLHLLGSVQSRRVGDRFGELHQEAAPFAGTRPGRELREQIHDSLVTAS
ncbi:transcriptional regulator [Streptomyces sp. NPDC001698]|uniref:transcriptional regulator n=1 Tax=Streptomyces sp. NPDC001698 TaxID=3364601 RepID=UPI0036919825